MKLISFRSGAADRLRVAFLLTALVLVVEVGGGLWAHSLALLSDAGHVVTDLLVLALSSFALAQVARPASARRTFGYHRVGILVALLNALLLGAIVVGIVLEAAHRLQHPGSIRGLLMAAAALLGLVISLLIARLLQPMQGDLTVRSALMHIWGDAWAAGGIVVGGVLIAISGWLAIDPLLSLAIAGLIAWGAWRVLSSAVDILLESTPSDVQTDTVIAAVRRPTRDASAGHHRGGARGARPRLRHRAHDHSVRESGLPARRCFLCPTGGSSAHRRRPRPRHPPSCWVSARRD